MKPSPIVTTLAELTPDGSKTAQFVGAEHGSQSSFYVSRNDPGAGPDLHHHPYSETFVVIEGAVRFTVGEQVLDASAGDVVVVPPQTAHGFTNVGEGPMLSVNIHAAASMAQVDLPSHRLDDGSYELD
jgi:quercetin dioxygenase-like cupin family protein